MPLKRRQFQRPLPNRSYKKIIAIATEGRKTERQYFPLLNVQSISNTEQYYVKVVPRKSHKSAPGYVLKDMIIYLDQEDLRETDQAWLVIDKDNWSDEQLMELYRWTQEQDNYHLAVSNPKFEYFLLLHFEDGKGITSVSSCDERLKRHLANYDKDINPIKIKREMILRAIQRAEQLDNPPCIDWPRVFGSTVYKLIKIIIQC
jgi:hypothetical protein